MYGRQDMIKNTALLLCEVCGKTHVIESNEVEARKVALRVLKEQSCNIVFEGDKICYKITLCNDSNIDLNNLEFRDRLSPEIDYERNSFKVNGECKNPEISGRNVCYYIDCLHAREEMVITFEAEVK